LIGVRLRFAPKDTVIMLVPMRLVLAALIIWPNVSLFLPRLIVPRNAEVAAKPAATAAGMQTRVSRESTFIQKVRRGPVRNLDKL
jgi:hypothetical protein